MGLMPKASLKNLLLDRLTLKELTPERTASLTGIPEQYIIAILEDKKDKLPPLPYIRGYLLKLADALEMSREEILQMYKNEFIEKVSGSADRLPGNRFALPSFKRRWIFIVLGLALIILGFSFSGRIFGQPRLDLTMPDPNENPYLVGSPTITLTGRIDPGDELLINNQPATVDATGAFSKEYRLDPELNTITFTVKRFLGKELTVTKQVYYKIQ